MNRFLDWILSRKTIGQTTMAGSLALLLLRVWIGLMMAFGHGWGKLIGFGEKAANFADPYGFGNTVSMGLAVFAEFFCSLAVILGLFTRATVIPLIITMLTAALIIHGGDPWGRKEMAILYLAPFVTLLVSGPGKYSLDRLFMKD